MDAPKKDPKTTRKWRKLSARVMKRCRGQCEWVRGDVNLRCARRASSVDMTNPDDSVSTSNMRALCEYHQLMADRSRETARFIGIRVRPPKED